MSLHDENCRCEACHEVRRQQFEEQQATLMEKYGWVAHYVPGVDTNYVNYHTHGFKDKWNHRDFQIVFPMPPEVAHKIFWGLSEMMEKGKKFADDDLGLDVWDVITNLPVRMMKVKEGERDVLRVIMPDPNGLFEGDEGVLETFAGQSQVDTAR